MEKAPNRNPSQSAPKEAQLPILILTEDILPETSTWQDGMEYDVTIHVRQVKPNTFEILSATTEATEEAMEESAEEATAEIPAEAMGETMQP